MIPKIERASRKEIKLFQEQKLQNLLLYLNTHSPYYKTLFKANAIAISKIKTLDDLEKIPPTTKEDLQQYNSDFICIPKHKIIDYVTTSGTLGNPVTFVLSENDLQRLAYNEAISFACAGINKNDILQLTTTIDRCFMAGLAYFLGARKLGAGIIRVGAGVPELQWDSILKFKPSYLIAVPSFLLKLIDYAKQHQIDINSSSVKGVICIGEPLRNQDFSLNTLSKKITDSWNIKLFSTYASTEMSTAFTECQAQKGGHQHPDLIIIEVLDEMNCAVADGETGELTITTLGIEAMPLLRFKTGDMVKAYNTPCSCGRNTTRLGPVLGRKKQMIKYKGTTLYPQNLYNLLNEFKAINNFVIEIFTNSIGTDEICIKMNVKTPNETFLHEINNHFRAKLRVSPKIEFYTNEQITKLQFSKLGRKPQVILDKRIKKK